jgi:hypothetical protein
MNNPLNNLKDEANKIRLSPQEKAYMRAQLLEVMRRSSVSLEPRRTTRSPYFFFAPQFAMPFVVLMILVLGGTTTYAAQGSLPGGVLYPVKIYVNEQVQGALAVSEEAKVSYHTAVAQERLKEAEVLASQGKLDGQTATLLEANFNDHVAKADTIAADLEQSDTATGVEAQIRLDSSLAAHSAILAHIGDESSDEQTKENSNSIAEHVRSRGVGGVVAVAMQAATMIAPTVRTTALVQEDTDASDTPVEGGANSHARFMAKTKATSTSVVSSATTTAQKKVALQLQKKATSQLHDAHQTFTNLQSALDASTTARVTAQLATLDAQLAAGSQQVAALNYTLARTTFSEVLRGSIELSALIEASKMYKHDFVHEDEDSHSNNDKDNSSSGSSSEEKGGGIQIKLNL